MKQKHTYEKKAAVKNGIVRMTVAGLSLIIQLVLLVLLFTKLKFRANLITLLFAFVGLVIILAIYSRDRTSSLKMPWIILILLMPAFGITLFLMIGFDYSVNRMKRRYSTIDDILFPMLPDNRNVLKMLHELDPAAGSIVTYIKNISRYPVYNNSDVTYFSSGLKGLEAQIHELKKAEKFIFMEYFAIEEKKAWGHILEVLEERVKAGVEVRIFYDDIGSISFISTDFVKRLEAKGIQCRVFNPCSPVLNMFVNNRDHRKITVIDGKVGFTGGYNLADEYFEYTHPYGHWKDAGIMIRGEAVKNLTITFLEMWNAVSGTDKDDAYFYRFLPNDVPARPEPNTFIAPYADSPMDDIHVGEDIYISMINKAERYCWFMTPYLIVTDEMIHALTLAARRGVDVRIITPGIPDKKMVYALTHSFYPALVRKGVRIYEWTPGFCHAKVCLVDDKMAACGTINLDYRSLYHHFEDGCFLYGVSAIKDIHADFEHTFDESRSVTEEYKKAQFGPKRLWQLFLRLFAGLM